MFINDDSKNDTLVKYGDALFAEINGVDGAFVFRWEKQCFYATSRQHAQVLVRLLALLWIEHRTSVLIRQCDIKYHSLRNAIENEKIEGENDNSNNSNNSNNSKDEIDNDNSNDKEVSVESTASSLCKYEANEIFENESSEMRDCRLQRDIFVNYLPTCQIYIQQSTDELIKIRNNAIENPEPDDRLHKVHSLMKHSTKYVLYYHLAMNWRYFFII